MSNLLSLASPHVILVEYGVLTLALQSTKILDGYQMVIQRRSSLRCYKSRFTLQALDFDHAYWYPCCLEL